MQKIKYIAIIILCMSFSLTMKAQWTFDFSSVEAYISDHKTQRSLLLARSTLEASNKLLHSYSSDATSDYKELNVDLDKYTRAFDVIDVVYQSLRVVMNTKNTYETARERISDYQQMLSTYNEKVLSRGKIEWADTVLISVNKRAIDNIARECGYLYRSLTDLVLYTTGAAACSTADLLMVLECINTSLDRIEQIINVAYFDTWRYIQVRTTYWKSKIYQSKTKLEITNEALDRWRKARKLSNE